MHLMKPDETKLGELFGTVRSIADRQKTSSEIIKDIYGTRVGNFYKYRLVKSMDPDDFKVKLESLKDCLDVLCPDFYNWFLRKQLFMKSIIQSAREATDINEHAVEKRNQGFKKESVVRAISNLKKQ